MGGASSSDASRPVVTMPTVTVGPRACNSPSVMTHSPAAGPGAATGTGGASPLSSSVSRSSARSSSGVRATRVAETSRPLGWRARTAVVCSTTCRAVSTSRGATSTPVPSGPARVTAKGLPATTRSGACRERSGIGAESWTRLGATRRTSESTWARTLEDCSKSTGGLQLHGRVRTPCAGVAHVPPDAGRHAPRASETTNARATPRSRSPLAILRKWQSNKPASEPTGPWVKSSPLRALTIRSR